MKKSAKGFIAENNKEEDIVIINEIQNVINKVSKLLESGNASDPNKCYCYPISQPAAVAILEDDILPQEGMIMSNKPSIMPDFGYVEKVGETIWFEVTRDEVEYLRDPDLELEVWISLAFRVDMSSKTSMDTFEALAFAS